MYKIENKKVFASFVVVMIAITGGLIFGVYNLVKKYNQVPTIERMTIKEAAKEGEKKTVQLLIQIADIKNVEGVLERGDVLLTADENKEFSVAEQEGFLIIKMRLTQSQQELLELSLKEQQGIFAKQDDRQQPKEIKRRKFAVDLAKIGIGPEQKMGKVITDKVFEDDALIEKK
ncbi:MAG: hypothetical protein HGA36_02780 [Candidatus Moranbacteria bacterium]|nr:hypothetical protein [Candidatus Moranbacteria bacterium]